MAKSSRYKLGMTYNYAEGFCLMKYASDDGMTVEWIWNSRDGITPFCIESVNGVMMRHIDWHLDRKIVDYKPQPGERIFVNATEENCKAKIEKYIDNWWEGLLKDKFESKKKAYEDLLKSWLKNPEAPAVIFAKELK